jgi:hypothetical protein
MRGHQFAGRATCGQLTLFMSENAEPMSIAGCSLSLPLLTLKYYTCVSSSLHTHRNPPFVREGFPTPYLPKRISALLKYEHSLYSLYFYK